MNVLHVAETIKGGVSTVISELIRSEEVERRGVRHFCLIPHDQCSELNIPSGVNVKTFERSGRDLKSAVVFSYCMVKLVLKLRPQIIHLHSTFAGLYGRIFLAPLKPILGFKLVYCSHGWAFLMDVSAFKKEIYRKIESMLEFLSDSQICISEYEFNKAKALNFKEEKLVLIRNGVRHLSALESCDDNERDNVVRILFVGRFDQQKGYDMLMRAFRRLDPLRYHLTIIGGGVLENVAVENTISNVTNLGWLPREEINLHYVRADVLVVPSRWEGFGLVAVEAMAQGTPVVASRVGGLSEIVIHGVNGYLFEPTESDLLESLSLLDKRKLREMRETCFKIYKEKFESSRMIKETINLYEKLLKGGA